MAKQKTEKPDAEKTLSPQNPKAARLAGREKLSVPGVVVLFAISFLVHVILNGIVNICPKVIIDEGLYTNIARSLAWEGKLAFRGQPVNYPYLLYPALLVPVYWLNRLVGGDVYRYVQVFNTLLITSSVFPMYYFSKDFTGDRKKAFLAAVIVACMPDMIMGGYEMTESVIWPLAMWMIFFCYRFFTTNELRYGLLTALFTGLMFSAKPGAIAAGAVMLLLHAVKTLRENKRKLKNSLLSILLLLTIVGVVYGIFLLLFGGPDSLLGLYTKQTSEWKPQDILVALEATFLLIFMFVFACGGIYGVFPLTHLPDYEREKRRFILSFLLGVLVAIIGTAVFVVPYKWTGELGALPLHLRYCSMFIPFMYVFAADIDLDPKYVRRFVIALSAFIVLSIFPGVRAGFVKGESRNMDSMTLCSFIITGNLNGRVTGWILTFIVVAFSSFIAINASGFRKEQQKGKRMRKDKSFHKLVTVYYIFFILFNAVCAHISASVRIDPTIPKDALEVNQIIADQECLGITQRHYDDAYSYWLDSRLNAPMQQVTIDQMFVTMENTGGVYSPFVPVEQSPNVNNHETPETDTFVLGKTIAEHLELRDTVIAETTANGHFTVVRIQPSERWVDTMMYGLDDNALYEGETGYLLVLDEGRNIGGMLTVTISAYGEGILNIGGTELKMEAAEKTYEVTVPFKKLISMSAKNGTVQILRYTTQKN